MAYLLKTWISKSHVVIKECASLHEFSFLTTQIKARFCIQDVQLKYQDEDKDYISVDSQGWFWFTQIYNHNFNVVLPVSLVYTCSKQVFFILFFCM